MADPQTTPTNPPVTNTPHPQGTPGPAGQKAPDQEAKSNASSPASGASGVSSGSVGQNVIKTPPVENREQSEEQNLRRRSQQSHAHIDRKTEFDALLVRIRHPAPMDQKVADLMNGLAQLLTAIGSDPDGLSQLADNLRNNSRTFGMASVENVKAPTNPVSLTPGQ